MFFILTLNAFLNLQLSFYFIFYNPIVAFMQILRQNNSTGSGFMKKVFGMQVI